ncbi:Acidic phosphoprotein precursor PCEMA1, putative, partial [Plasmodium chabaudi adami]
SIIFSIVLARNSSGSKSTTGCFPFCRKKTKKSYKIDEPVKVEIKDKGTYDPDIPNIKFIDESNPIIFEVHDECQTRLSEPFTSETDGTTVDKVTGFLRRENDSIERGWYIRPYEEEPEDMINDNFTSFENNYQPFQSTPQNSNERIFNLLALLTLLGNQGLSTPDEYTEIYEEVSFFRYSYTDSGIEIRQLWVHRSGR